MKFIKNINIRKKYKTFLLAIILASIVICIIYNIYSFIVKELNLDGIQFFSIGKKVPGKSHSFNPALYKTDNIECSSENENDNFNKDEYLKHLSEDVFTVKIRERSTGRIIELNPNIDNSFSDTMTRNLFHSGEYILISGNLPDKWK